MRERTVCVCGAIEVAEVVEARLLEATLCVGDANGWYNLAGSSHATFARLTLVAGQTSQIYGLVGHTDMRSVAGFCLTTVEAGSATKSAFTALAECSWATLPIVEANLVINASPVFATFVGSAGGSPGTRRGVSRVWVRCGRVVRVIRRAVGPVVRRIIRVVVRIVVWVRIANDWNCWVGGVSANTDSTPAHTCSAITVGFATRVAQAVETSRILPAFVVERTGYLAGAVGTLTAGSTFAISRARSTDNAATIKTHFIGAAVDIDFAQRNTDAINAAELACEAG